MESLELWLALSEVSGALKMSDISTIPQVEWELTGAWILSLDIGINVKQFLVLNGLKEPTLIPELYKERHWLEACYPRTVEVAGTTKDVIEMWFKGNTRYTESYITAQILSSMIEAKEFLGADFRWAITLYRENFLENHFLQEGGEMCKAFPDYLWAQNKVLELQPDMPLSPPILQKYCDSLIADYVCMSEERAWTLAECYAYDASDWSAPDSDSD